MKIPYFAPDISFIPLDITGTGASNCSGATANNTDGSCQVTVNDLNTTLINKGTCEAYSPSLASSLCYYTSVDGLTVFGS
ncbi:MAG: hypothetical protein K6B52_07790 [Clostridiales bacterium]|nr:hypothetical protein [Clostridiales bacterium]